MFFLRFDETYSHYMKKKKEETKILVSHENLDKYRHGNANSAKEPQKNRNESETNMSICNMDQDLLFGNWSAIAMQNCEKVNTNANGIDGIKV